MDFKRQFDINSTEAWCEVIKDIVAMANSGGGVIVFGVEDDGTNAKMDHAPLLAFDTANIATKIAKYTGHQFDDVEVIEVERAGKAYAAFLVAMTEVPVVFTKPGTYELPDKKQKTAFGQGTIYFRHGSKSEHGNRNDLAGWRDREINTARKNWLGGIRKVVETSPGDTVTVIASSAMSPKFGSMVQAAISNDPSALKFTPTNSGDIWPYRQVDLIREVNKKLPADAKINSHDILCIKSKYDILNAHPEYAHKPHKLMAPQYSPEFIEWLLAEYKKNKNFFRNARKEHKPK